MLIYAFSHGLRSFHRGDKATSQSMMRFRIVAQGFTVVAFMVGSIFFGMKPHDRPKSMEEKMERKL